MAEQNTLSSRCVVMFLVGFCLFQAGIGGLYIFAQSEWLSFAGPFPGDWEGYDAGQFTGLIIFTFLTPVGFALLFVLIQHLLRIAATKSFRTHLFAICLAVTFVSGGIVFGIYWASDFIECMGVGCVDDSKYKPYDPRQPEAGIGFQNVTGSSFQFSCCLFVFITYSDIFAVCLYT